MSIQIDIKLKRGNKIYFEGVSISKVFNLLEENAN